MPLEYEDALSYWERNSSLSNREIIEQVAIDIAEDATLYLTNAHMSALTSSGLFSSGQSWTEIAGLTFNSRASKQFMIDAWFYLSGNCNTNGSGRTGISMVVSGTNPTAFEGEWRNYTVYSGGMTSTTGTTPFTYSAATTGMHLIRATGILAVGAKPADITTGTASVYWKNVDGMGTVEVLPWSTLRYAVIR